MHQDRVSAAVWHPEGGTIATCGWDGVAQVITDPALPARPLLKVPAMITKLAWSPDGNRIAVSAWDERAYIMVSTESDPAVADRTYLIQRRLEGHTAALHSVSWSPDGQLLVTSSGDGTLRLWSASGEDPDLRRDRLSSGEAYEVSWSPDGDLFASVSRDGRLRIWDVAEAAVIAEFEHSGAAHSVAWRPDGQCIAVGTDGGTIHLWHVEMARTAVLVSWLQRVCTEEEVRREILDWRGFEAEREGRRAAR